MEPKQEINAELICFQLAQLAENLKSLKNDISSLSNEVKLLSGNGCFVGKTNCEKIKVLEDRFAELEKKPKEQVIFFSVLLGVILTVLGILQYLHNSMPNEKTNQTISQSK